MRKERMSRKKKRLISLLLTAFMAAVLAMGSVTAFAEEADAAEEDEYTYTVRIFAGNQGTIKSAPASQNGVTPVIDGSSAVYTGLEYGDRISFKRSGVTLKNGKKYYVKEMRESGKDNYDPKYPQLSSVKVTADKDYVVAYAMSGSAVKCTIQYVDANGKSMHADEEFYGNIGDKPVVASQYVDGYFPDAYNKTLTLKESGNTVKFVYQPVPVTVTTTTVTQTAPATTQTTGTTANRNTGNTAGTTANNAGNNARTAGNPAGGNAGGNAGGTAANNAGNTPGGNEAAAEPALPATPEEVPEVVNIDSGEVPLAEAAPADGEEIVEEGTDAEDEEVEEAEVKEKKNPIGLIAAAAAAAIAAGVAVYLIHQNLQKKRNQK